MAVCSKPSNNKCSCCKSTFYCDAEHQRADWKSHKKTCAFAPYATQVQGILLPTTASPPKLVPVKCQVRSLDPSDRSEVVIFDPDLKAHLGGGNFERKVISTMGGPNERPIKHWLWIFMRDNFVNDGSPVNESVLGLTGGPTPHKWRGNLLVLKSATAGEDDGRFQDANLGEDVRAVKGWLKWYGSQDLWSLSDLPFTPTHVVNLGKSR